MNKTGTNNGCTVSFSADAPAIERARLMIARLKALGFTAYRDTHGVLLITDSTGRRRDVSRFLPIADVFDELVAGLADDPRLLDLCEEEGERK